MIDVLGPEKRRRRTTQEKIAIVQQSFEPGASELAAAMKQIKELQRLLGKKTMKNELLKEAVEYGRAKKWIAHAPLLPGDGE
ncbi:insertion sequence 2 OrfA protein [Shigella flexneri]|nr:insertion sequence 2 OrfA protein [Shigella flexneri]